MILQVAPPITEAWSDNERRFVFDYAISVEEWRLRILRGYLSDGATIPRLAWRIVGQPLQGMAQPGSAFHDPAYEAELFVEYCDGDRRAARLMADRMFHKVLLATGMGRTKAWLFHKAVEAGGWTAWNRHTPETVAAARKMVVLDRGPDIGVVAVRLLPGQEINLASMVAGPAPACYSDLLAWNV